MSLVYLSSTEWIASFVLHAQQRPPNIILPLSKVILQGVITAIYWRPNGCILLVLDDGTGSIDVRYWDSDDSNGPQQRQKKPLSIGDYCEVLGKIKPMTAGTKYSCNCLGNDVRFGCIREIHASSVCTMNRNHSTNTNTKSNSNGYTLCGYFIPY